MEKENISDVVRMIFGEKEGFEKLSKETKKQMAYILNRKIAKYIPLQAAYISTLNPEHVLDVLYSILRRYKRVPNDFWFKEKTGNTKKSFKETYNKENEEEKDCEYFSKETIVSMKKNKS